MYWPSPYRKMMRVKYRRVKLRREWMRRECLRSLYSFTKYFWPVIEPGQPFKDGWHIEVACKHLEAAARFDLKELVINWPPRHMKSILVNIMFPAWVWAHEEWASRKFMCASYSERLSVRDGVKMRMLIESKQYRGLFEPSWDLRADQNQKLKFENTKSGHRFSTSVGGSVTGEGGDYLLLDDPINALDSNSKVILEDTNEWYDIAWSTRANNQNAHCKILIMQRLHEKDTTGHILSKQTRPLKSERAHLVFQARFDPTAKIKSESPIPFKDPRVTPGELLWPDRFDQKAINQLAADLDATGLGQSFSQLQQEPRPATGGLFKRDWWRRYEKPPSLINEIIVFIDAAQKPGITNDFSALATWARCADGYYLLDLWRGKVDTPTLEAITMQKYLLIRPNGMVIEDKSAGSSLIQYLVRLDNPLIPVLPYNPRGDKEVRASAATPAVEAGKCFLPSRKIISHDDAGNEIDLIEEFINEHERFPKGAHDDLVDTTSMMIDYFSKRLPINPRIRSL